jgi:ParB/RepB/Spo0J family partition protein
MVAAFSEPDAMFLNSILVRPLRERYQVVDGMYRWTAAHEAGMKVFQCTVKEMPDKDVLIHQIKANADRQGTDPVEYARHLHRLMDLSDSDMTLKDLAEMTERSRSWVCEMMKLTELCPEYQKMVQRGQITVANGQLLAKLKPYLQPQHVEAARVESVTTFRRTIAEAVNHFREAVREGRSELFWAGEIKPHMRKMPEILHELETWQVGGKMIVQHDCVSALDGWKLGIQWIMNQDSDRIEELKAKKQRVELDRLADMERLEAIREGRKHEAFGDAD